MLRKCENGAKQKTSHRILLYPDFFPEVERPDYRSGDLPTEGHGEQAFIHKKLCGVPGYSELFLEADPSELGGARLGSFLL